MMEISSTYMFMQSRYDDAKAWDTVLVKLDHLTDPELKVLKLAIAPVLVRIFRSFPDQWKLTKVRPLFK